jgi:acid stress-induced BolA-like protein IbaG/YrbA
MGYQARMTPEQVKNRIQERLGSGTEVEIIDLTGTMDHYQAIVISPAFDGKIMIEQHRMVMGTLQAEIDSGEVHALTMRTFTPVQYQKYIGG